MDFAADQSTQGTDVGVARYCPLDALWIYTAPGIYLIYSTQHTIRFPDRFAVVNFNLGVRTIRFPAPGSYEFVLFIDADEVAHRRVRVYQAPPEAFI